MHLGKLAVILVFGLLLVLPSDSGSSMQDSSKLDLKSLSAQPSNSDYIPHDQIYIWSDTDFEEQEWPGSGTSEDPFIIAGLNISGLSISSCSVYFIVRDCLFSGSINLDYVKNGVLENLVFGQGGERGINLWQCEEIVIKDCTLTEQGIRIYGNSLSNWIHTMENISIGGKPLGYLYDMTDSSIDASAFGQLIIVDCKRIDLDGGMVNIPGGFTIAFSEDCSLHSFTVNLNAPVWQSNYVFESKDVHLENITFERDSWSAILIDNCDNITIERIKSTGWNSQWLSFLRIELWNSPNSYINEISYIGGECNIEVRYSRECTITRSNASNVDLRYSPYSTITNCTIIDADIDDSSYCNITGSAIENIVLKNSNYTIVSNCTSQRIRFTRSVDCQVNDTAITEGGIEIAGSELSHWIHTFDNVTIGGKTCGYFVGLVDATIDCSSFGQLILVDCEGVTADGGIASNFSGSLIAAFSENCSINNVYKNNGSSGGVILYSCNSIFFENISIYSINDPIFSIIDCTSISFVQSIIHCYSWTGATIQNSSSIFILDTSSVTIRGYLDITFSNDIFISQGSIAMINLFDTYSCIFAKISTWSIDLWNCRDIGITDSTVNYLKMSLSKDCQFENVLSVDIRIYGSTDCEFKDIIIEDGAINIRGNSRSYWSHSFTNVSINGKPFGFFRGLSQSDISSEGFSQLVLVDCQQVNIQGRNSSSFVSNIQVVYSDDCTITDLVLKEKISILESTNIGIDNITGVGDMNYVSIEECSDVILQNSVLQSSYSCIYIYGSSNCYISNNILGSPFLYSNGITVSSSDEITLSNNTINSASGIAIFNSELVTCSDNTIGSSYTGIELYNSVNCVVERNNITNPSNGIIAVHNEYCLYSGNQITNSDDGGIQINGEYQSTFSYNYITGSGNYAINIALGDANKFFGNYLGDDVIDDGENNEWYNQRGFGNYWAGHPSGELINLNGSAGSIDSFPLTIDDDDQQYPTITNPPDFITGTSTAIRWVAWCDPGDYVLFFNGMATVSGVWTGSGHFQIHITTMEGEWLEYTLSIYNDDDWSIADTVRSSGVIRIEPVHLTIAAGGIIIAAIIVFEMSNRITKPLQPSEEK